MATTDPKVQPLLIFSGEKYILIDDYNQKILGEPVLISSTWPQLSQWQMDRDLDAAYRDPVNNLIAFFKKDQCAIYNVGDNSWSQGKITEYFSVPAEFSSDLDGATFAGASDGGLTGNLYMLKGTNFANGTATTPTKANPAALAGPYPVGPAGWTPWPSGARIVGAEDIFPPESASKSLPQPFSTLVLADEDNYKCWFFPALAGANVIKTLNDLWPGYNALKMTPVNAVMRLDASLLGKGGTPAPAPSPSHNPFHPGPVLGGGGSGPNSLCDDLPTIMKSICSLTVLMHKVVDACYPQSSWPTQPYPDGCGSGHKHKGDCGCKDKQKETASVAQKTTSSGQ